MLTVDGCTKLVSNEGRHSLNTGNIESLEYSPVFRDGVSFDDISTKLISKSMLFSSDFKKLSIGMIKELNAKSSAGAVSEEMSKLNVSVLSSILS